jgi:hypothetical protein
MFSEQRARILATLDEAHAAYYRAQVFGGPSLHFHLTSLRASGERDFNRFTEQVYAVLASWGMHRMGPGGSKMRDFDDFRESIRGVWPKALPLQEKSDFNLSETEWSDLKEIFQGIRCMASGTTLVGNSKVMAHLLPNLVPPIDREYTLKLLYKHGQIVNGLEREWAIFREVLAGFFHSLAQMPSVRAKTSEWMEQQVYFKWDTSVLKILDNLVIGCRKMPGPA